MLRSQGSDVDASLRSAAADLLRSDHPSPSRARRQTPPMGSASGASIVAILHGRMNGRSRQAALAIPGAERSVIRQGAVLGAGEHHHPGQLGGLAHAFGGHDQRGETLTGWSDPCWGRGRRRQRPFFRSAQALRYASLSQSLKVAKGSSPLFGAALVSATRPSSVP